MHSNQQDFIEFALSLNVLKFGDFTLKSGRQSPYFFNAGLFNDGESLARLGNFYAEALCASGVEFDMLYGAAYKGIPLVAATSVALYSKHGRNCPWAFNRKEEKDHGEKGNLVGSPLQGRVVIVDDVVSAGTSVRESVQIISAAGATPAAVLVALDRQERGKSELSALEESAAQFGVKAVSIVNLRILMTYLEKVSPRSRDLERIRIYSREYGARGTG